MARTVLTNADWAQLAPLFPKRGPAQHRRKRLEGILWVHRTGAPWRDVPRGFGRWERVESGFPRWSKSGLWARVWEVLRQRLGEDHEALYLDSTSVKAHRHSAGARGKGRRLSAARAAGAAPRCTRCATG